jgi:hypothetical protein
MIPAILNLSLNQNSDYTYTIACYQSPSTGNVSFQNLGPIYPLTGYNSAKLHVRISPLQTSTLIFAFASTPSAGQGTITINGSAGSVTMSASYSLLASLIPGGYFYDLLLENTFGSPTTVSCLVQGSFLINDGVTIP